MVATQVLALLLCVQALAQPRGNWIDKLLQWFFAQRNKAKSKSSTRTRANKDLQGYQGYEVHQGYQDE